ncbi:MAG: monovalent cation/H(+) antiporter subunit G [Spirochaetales bacterium]|nr:monovalent cation/H(+) antiporter subunit G [Candidatus Physcosoma equi]
MAYFKFILSTVCLVLGMFVFILETVALHKFKRPLNRLHLAALGDTMGIFLIVLGLVIVKGFTFATLKLVAIVLFFWLASPVSSHMLARFEAETDKNLGELEVEEK